ncbi:MAG: type II toxin-antitoxin system VapC family toxin [Caldiserica bacterium]|nr:type II toxin-antitoxin system VapC family toxin [Caldisericota bacterium]
MKNYILDTSVIFKWYRHQDEPYIEEALYLLEKFSTGEIRIHIPILVFYEIGNAFSLKKNIKVEEKEEYLKSLYALGLEVYSLTPELATNTLLLAERYKITFYDSCFISLAEILNFPFITADEKLYRKIKNIKGVQLLKEVEKWD